MQSEQVELEFEFSNEELANFLENFSEKLRDGQIGLSFKGREELKISPNKESNIELNFVEEESSKQLMLEIEIAEEDISLGESQGREKIQVMVDE